MNISQLFIKGTVFIHKIEYFISLKTDSDI